MKLISSIEEFRAAKAAFVAKYGDNLIMACGSIHQTMLEELEPLAKFSKMPADKLLALFAKARVEGLL